MLSKNNLKRYAVFSLLLVVVVTAVLPQSTAAAPFGAQTASLYQQMTDLLQKMRGLLAGQVISASTINVTNSAELLAALSAAVGGETIYLAPGDYTLGLWSVTLPATVYPSEVIVTSKDPSNMAAFTQMGLNGVQNLTFDKVKFDYRFKSGEPDYYRPFTVTGGSGQAKNITIRNSVFDGDVAAGTGDSSRDGFGTAYGLGIDGRGAALAEGIVIENNQFSKWMRAGVFNDVNNLTVRGNEVSDIRSDGFDFASIQTVTIENNYMHDFNKSANSGDHMDMIQFWTSGTTRPNTNISIRNNWLLAEGGDWTQSIFMRNEKVDSKQSGAEMFYKNVTIENNVIHNGHLHGITLGETDGVIVRNNTLLHNRDAGNEGTVSIPNINMSAASINVSVTKNIMPIAKPATERVNYTDNMYVQQLDQTQPNYYNDYFLNALAQGNATKKDLMVIPGSVVDTGNYGSTLLKPVVGAAYFTALAGKGFDSQNLTLSAKGSGVTAASWNFGDGKTGTGIDAVHSYANPGTYTVTLTATQNGKNVTIKRTLKVESPIAFRADFTSGFNDTSAWGLKGVSTGAIKVADGTLNYVAGAVQSVSYDDPSLHLLNNKQYTFAFDTRFPTTEKSAWTVYFSGSFIINVSPTGGTFVIIGDGVSKTITVPLSLSLNAWHRVVVVFTGDATNVKIYIDGTLVSDQNGMGSVQVGSIYHSLTLGDPWAVATPHNLDNVIFLKGAMDATQVAAYVKDGSLPVGSPIVTPSPTPVPTVAISATPAAVVTGSNTTLAWSTTNATACTASGDWSGTKATTGTLVLSALTLGTKTYTLTCTGAGGSAIAATAVTVTASPVVVTPTLTLGVTPTALTTGNSAVLTWSSTDTTGCTASGDWSGAKTVNGTQSTGALTSGNKTYTLTCTTNTTALTKTVTVSVTDVVPPPIVVPATSTTMRVETLSNLNVRTVPNGTRIGTQPLGAQGTMASTTIATTGGYDWVYVNFDNVPDGYVVKSYLKDLTVNTTTSLETTIRYLQSELVRLQKLLRELQSR